MNKITRRRWRHGETRYELAVRGSEVVINTFPSNLREMNSRFFGYTSIGCRRSFDTPEEAKNFVKKLNPREFQTLEGLGFKDFTELIIN